MNLTKSNSEKDVRPRKEWASSAFSNRGNRNNASRKVFSFLIKTPSHAAHRFTPASSRAELAPVRRRPSSKSWQEILRPSPRKVVSRPVTSHLSEPATQTLERYRGTVDRVAGDMVDLTLEDQHGELSAAKMSVAQMAEFGLALTEDFECTVTKQGSEVKVKFTPIPRQRLSLEASARLRAEIDAAYQDFDDDF